MTHPVDSNSPVSRLGPRLLALTLVAVVAFSVVFGLRRATNEDLATGAIFVSVGESGRNSFFNENAVGDYRAAFQAADVLDRTSARTSVSLADLRFGLATRRLSSTSRVIAVTFRHADRTVVIPVLDTIVDEVDLYLRRARALEDDVELLDDLAAAENLLQDMDDVVAEAGVASLPDTRRRLAADVRITRAQIERLEPGDPGRRSLEALLLEREAALEEVAASVARYRIVADDYADDQIPLIRRESARAVLSQSLALGPPLGPAEDTGRRAGLVGDVRAGLSAAGIAVLIELAVFWIIDRRRDRDARRWAPG